MIECICQQCSEHFMTYPCRIKLGHGKFCSPKCHGLSITGRHQTQEIKNKISSGMKRVWSNPNSCTKRAKANSMGAKRMWQRSEHRIKMATVMSQPEVKEKRAISNSIAAKRLWQRPEYISKLMKAIHAKPNKPEQRLIDIFSKYLPQFHYNGDFRLEVVLGGLIPDFVNVDGHKEVIELFGDYHHSPEIVGKNWRRGELGKVMIYNSLGWKCLVIWESELNQLSENEVIEKVNRFFLKERHAVHSG